MLPKQGQQSLSLAPRGKAADSVDRSDYSREARYLDFYVKTPDF